MGDLSMLKLQEELKQDALSRFHLIYGEERYMVRYYKKCLRDRLSAPDDEMNCTIFQGEKTDPAAVADVAQILPFMVPQRLIIIQDSGFFKKATEMTEYLSDFPDSTYVVFVEREVDKRNKLYKWLGKNGCITECQHQTEPMLRKWIAGYLKREKKTISGEAVEHLMERVGTDMETLGNELDKLIGYTGERPDIGSSDIDAVCSGLTVSRIFDMIDAVAAGERDKALRYYNDLLANKESPMSILYLLSRHINILLQIRELTARGLNRGELAKKIGIPPFTVPKYSKQAAAFRSENLRQMLETRVEYEERLKKGRLSDQLAVEMFLIQALTNGTKKD